MHTLDLPLAEGESLILDFLVLGVAAPYPGGTFVLTGLVTADGEILLMVLSDLTWSSATAL